MSIKKLALPVMGLAMMAGALAGCHFSGETLSPSVAPAGYHYHVQDNSAGSLEGYTAGFYSSAGAETTYSTTGYNVASDYNMPLVSGTMQLFSTNNSGNLSVRQYDCGWNYFRFNSGDGRCRFLADV